MDQDIRERMVCSVTYRFLVCKTEWVGGWWYQDRKLGGKPGLEEKDYEINFELVDCELPFRSPNKMLNQ